MRCFVAVDIDESVRRSIAKLAGNIAAKGNFAKGNVTWVKTENMHLTLKFLGEVKDSQIYKVCKAVRNAAMNFGPFELKVKGVGTFGGKSASVLWIGTESDELNAIAEAIDKELIEIGFPPEKRAFKGHLTLARIRNFDAGTKIIEACKEYKDFDAKSSLVDTVTVYQSQLTNQGSIYTVIDKSELTPNA